MALPTHFVGKRESDVPTSRTALSPGAQSLQAAMANRPSAKEAPANTVPPQMLTVTDSPGQSDGGSMLKVGLNIKLKGVEITDCDTLFVEGSVEATMDSRLMLIAEQGSFRGKAEIDMAEISGGFDGILTVRQKLVIRSTGRVSGKIRYGKLMIEEGGHLQGEVDRGSGSGRPLAAADPLAASPAVGTPSPSENDTGQWVPA